MNLASQPPADDDPAAVGAFETQAKADEYALVALAMGLECSLVEQPLSPKPFVLLAAQNQVESIRCEFAAYTEEQSEPEAAPADPPAYHGGWGFALIWVVALLVSYHFQCQDPQVTDRFSNSSRALFDLGEWWRPFTALFLHADLGHLFGNLFYGLGLILLVTSRLGVRTGWLLVFASGTIGNILTAWIHYPSGYHSLGASTATFGALGILTGVSSFAAWIRRTRHKPLHLLIPAIAGIILLGWLGSGQAPTDVVSHLFGFVTGGILGWLAAQGQSAPPLHQ